MDINQLPSRRNFLFRFILSWIALIVLPMLYAIIQYLLPANFKENLMQSMAVAKVPDIPADGIKIVRFNKKPVILLRNQQEQIRAMSAVCTHLGCIVEYNSAQKNFQCNCHGSIFTIDGVNVSGPASRPLEPYRVEVKNNEVIISKI